MIYGDRKYTYELGLAKISTKAGKDTGTENALLAAHERVLTLEAEIKLIIDGADKDRKLIIELLSTLEEYRRRYGKLNHVEQEETK